MGTFCCSDNTKDTDATMVSLQPATSHNYTMKEIALIVKIQANFRGLIARKKVRQGMTHAGMADQKFDDA
tara:strand:+ start:115 stop:324 length:210 start_codon:yes stop_codon:yes gene_type:complete